VTHLHAHNQRPQGYRYWCPFKPAPPTLLRGAILDMS
jgi:hypothetical protein